MWEDEINEHEEEGKVRVCGGGGGGGALGRDMKVDVT